MAGQRQAIADVLDQFPDASAPEGSFRPGVIVDPAAGRWLTVDGSICPYQLIAPEGGVFEEGEGDFVQVPELTLELRTDPGCEWQRVG